MPRRRIEDEMRFVQRIDGKRHELLATLITSPVDYRRFEGPPGARSIVKSERDSRVASRRDVTSTAGAESSVIWLPQGSE